MPAGFEVYNDYGTLLISDTNPVLALRQKTNVVSTGTTFPNVTVLNTEMPAVAVACEWTVYMGAGSVAGTTRTYGLRSQHGTPTGVSANVYVFDRPVSSGNSGLQVFDAAGNLTFDALGKYGRVAAVYASNATLAVPAGRTYAVMVTSTRYRDEIKLDPFNSANRIRQITGTGCRVLGGTAYIEDCIISTITYGSSDPVQVIRDTGGPSGVILDVTGY